MTTMTKVETKRGGAQSGASEATGTGFNVWGTWLETLNSISAMMWNNFLNAQREIAKLQEEVIKQASSSVNPEIFFNTYKNYLDSFYSYVESIVRSFQSIFKVNASPDVFINFFKRVSSIYTEQFNKLQSIHREILEQMIETTKKQSEDIASLLKNYQEKLHNSFSSWQQIFDEIKRKAEETLTTGNQSTAELFEHLSNNISRWWNTHMELWNKFIKEYQKYYTEAVEKTVSATWQK